MPADEQGAANDRYTIIPRTAIFLREGDSFLLIKGSPTKRLWPDQYNGVGGHVDRGEDVLASAVRELREETGLEAALWLCGTVVVNAGPVGIGLYVFSGEVAGGRLRSSAEGTAEWIPYERIPFIATVGDVPQLVARIHQMSRGDPPFAARSYYDDQGNLQLKFAS